MSSTFHCGNISLSLFGQSHGEAVGMVLDGLPAGEAISLDELHQFMQKRSPGKENTSARQETDLPRILSGVKNGVTCGAPLCIMIENTDCRSKDYSDTRFVPRPSHADYPAFIKHHGMEDYAGGGHFSARMTAPMCACGGILLQLLARRNIFIGGHIAQIFDIQDDRWDGLNISKADFDMIEQNPLPVLNLSNGMQMVQAVKKAKKEGDSVGGMIECAVLGLPVGIGEPLFDGLENKIAQAMFAIPAVKGISFGDGFGVCQKKGSQHNDPYKMVNGRPTLCKNDAGGILGGLSTGAPLTVQVAFKPTPSIAIPQQSINLQTRTDCELLTKGRHDPCIVLRALPIVMSQLALSVAGFVL